MESTKLVFSKKFFNWFKSQSLISKVFIVFIVVTATLIYNISPLDLFPGMPLDDIAVTGFSAYTLYKMFSKKKPG